jgi:hypothetical protein
MQDEIPIAIKVNIPVFWGDTKTPEEAILRH